MGTRVRARYMPPRLRQRHASRTTLSNLASEIHAARNLAREIHAAFKLNEQDACRFQNLASEMHAALTFRSERDACRRSLDSGMNLARKFEAA